MLQCSLVSCKEESKPENIQSAEIFLKKKANYILLKVPETPFKNLILNLLELLMRSKQV